MTPEPPLFFLPAPLSRVCRPKTILIYTITDNTLILACMCRRVMVEKMEQESIENLTEQWKSILNIRTQRAAFVYLPTNKVFVYDGWDTGGRLYLKAVDPAKQDVLPHLMRDDAIPEKIIFVVDPEDIPVENRRYDHESRKNYEFQMNTYLWKGLAEGKRRKDDDAYWEDYRDICELIRITTIDVQIGKAD